MSKRDSRDSLQIGDVAERTGYPVWKLRRALDTGLPGVSVGRSDGNFRTISVKDINAIIREMKKRYGPPRQTKKYQLVKRDEKKPEKKN